MHGPNSKPWQRNWVRSLALRRRIVPVGAGVLRNDPGDRRHPHARGYGGERNTAMSTTQSAYAGTTGANSRLRAWIARHSLPAFFALAFALTWPFMIADALRAHGFLPADTQDYLLLGQAYGPTWAALIVTGATSGKAGIRGLLGKLLVWRVGPQWYAAAIGIPFVLFFLPIQLYALLGGQAPPLPTLSPSLILNLVVLLVVGGLINGEEIGWRGYALPRLQAQHNALTASLILGTITFLFHLPLFVTSDSIQTSMPMFGFLVEIVAGTVITTWIYNNTRGSLLLAYLGHAATNTWGHSQVFPVTAAVPLFWLHVGLVVLVAVVIVIVSGAMHLSRTPVADVAVQRDTTTVERTARPSAGMNRHA